MVRHTITVTTILAVRTMVDLMVVDITAGDLTEEAVAGIINLLSPRKQKSQPAGVDPASPG